MRVGFVGLGNIGRPMASHLAPAGFETTVFDIDAAAVAELVRGGARAAGSPREVAARADVIGICVPNDEQVRSVVQGPDGLLAGAAPGALVAIHSTILPRTVRELAAAAAEKGVAVIDACVTGGDQRAAEGTLTYLVGGDADAVARARPYLEPSSRTIVLAGGTGSGAALKLAINVLTYIQWAAAYEAFHLARAAGLDPAVFEEAGRANGQLTELQQRFLTSHKLPAEAVAGAGFQQYVTRHMHTAEKDLAWALDLARDAGVSLPVSGLVSQLMARLYRVEDPGRRG
jgi:3-hydroxyisobutyrate dehydrogenase-like beta-hydroxyacid dehydrogenase